MGADAAFPPQEHEARLEAVRAAMRERGLDALLLVSPENVYYLAGLSHQGYFAFTMLVLPLEGRPRLVARAMERHTIAAQCPGVEHVPFADHEEPAEGVVRALRDAGLAAARLGVERDTMFFPPLAWDGIREALPGADWRDASGLVDDLRVVKSPREIQHVRRAAALSDRALQAGILAARPGANEREVAAEVLRTMVLLGSEHPGIVPLVRSREYLLREHETWRDRLLRAGDALFMELSASVARYHAPVSRMVYLGVPPEGVERSAEVAGAGLDAVLRALRPGARSGEVYAAWQAVADEALGPGRYRRHHCGYSVGIGFPPSWVGGSRVVGLRPGGTMEIREGMVFHVLSWLLGTDLADYVVSDTVLVTASGGELLTETTRDPIVAE